MPQPLSSPVFGEPAPNIFASWDSVQAAAEIASDAWTLVALTDFTDVQQNAAVVAGASLVSLTIINTGEVALNAVPRRSSDSIAALDGTVGVTINPGDTYTMTGLWGFWASAKWIGLRAYAPPAYSAVQGFTTTVRMFAGCYSQGGVS